MMIHVTGGGSYRGRLRAEANLGAPLSDMHGRFISIDGRLTLQDLMQMKEWVARQLDVTPNDASRIETALLFVRAGGDLEAWTWDREDALRLIRRQRPSVEVTVTPDKLNRAGERSRWEL